MSSSLKKIMRYRDDSQSELDDKISLLSQTDSQADHDEEPVQKFWSRALITQVLTAIMLLVSLSINVMAWLKLSEHGQNNFPKYDPGFVSPALRDLGFDFHDHFINGSLKQPSIYRRKPSQEVDDAWLALGTDFGSIVVPVEEAPIYGIKQGQVKRVDEQGGGYMADLFIFHNLHCLNLIRQTSHFQWDYYRALAYTDKAPGTAFEAFDGEENLEEHFTHCLDMLRQEIMCDANINIFSQWFVENPETGPSIPTKDFSYTRKCRNFDAIKDWHGQHGIDMKTTLVRHQPGDPILDHHP